jgi:signal transduction histidine kinase
MPLALFLPFLLWAAARFGSAGVALSVLGTVLLATGGVFYDDGLFPTVPSEDRVRALQLFLISSTVPLMCVGALVEERQATANALRSSDRLKSSILTAIPDLLFVLRRDGTYLDYHVKDPNLLFVPPTTFLGRKIRDIMPSGLSDLFMDALERASQTGETIMVEYELPLSESPRHFEARIAPMGDDQLLSIVRDVTESKRAEDLTRALAGRLIASQEVERHRIARELHDDLSQQIAVLSIGIGQLADDIQTRREQFRELTNQAHEIASGVRNVSHELHPWRLEILGLAASLRSLCSDMSRQGPLKVFFSHDALPKTIDPNISLSMYRIAQEALHNVARHSGAVEAQVHLTCDDGTLALQITDGGMGFHQAGQHDGLGLISMRERAAFLRGQLTIHSRPGSGTRVAVRVPIARS